MSIPDFQILLLPTLRLLGDGEVWKLADLEGALADEFSLTVGERQEMTSSGSQRLMYNRVYWAATYLFRAGLIDWVGKGAHRIASRGEEVLHESPTQLDIEYLSRFVDKAELRGISSSSRKRVEPQKRAEPQKRVKSQKIRQPSDAKITPSRTTLFRSILQEAGNPLHYTDIHQRALVQLPKEHHFPKRLAYATLAARKNFYLVGDGVFGLAEWATSDNEDLPTSPYTTAEGEVRFFQCPQPLLPENPSPRAFFESIIYARDLLREAPTLSARQFYMRMCEWAGQSIFQMQDAQTAFDAWYCVGLVEHLNFATQARALLQLTAELDASIAEIRIHCLHSLCHRVARMPELLDALKRLSQPTTPNLNMALIGNSRSNPDLVRRLNILLALEGVRRDGDKWQLTRTGEAALQKYPPQSVLLLDKADDIVPTVQETNGFYDALSGDILYELDLNDIISQEKTEDRSPEPIAPIYTTSLLPLEDGSDVATNDAAFVIPNEVPTPHERITTPEPAKVPEIYPIAASIALNGLESNTEPSSAHSMTSSIPISTTPQESVSVAPTWTHQALQQHMRQCLAQTLQILFPLSLSEQETIIPHNWRNPTYVGESEGKVVAWRGWSANLAQYDSTYNTIYIDFVENLLPVDERRRLFGDDFTGLTLNLESFVVIHLGGLNPAVRTLVWQEGYSIRVMGQTIHACMASSSSEFIEGADIYWAARMARLANLHRVLKKRIQYSQETHVVSQISNLEEKPKPPEQKPKGWRKWFRSYRD